MSYLDPVVLDFVPVVIGPIRISQAMTDHQLTTARGEVEFRGSEGHRVLVKTDTQAEFSFSAASFSQLEDRLFGAVAQDGAVEVIVLQGRGAPGGRAKFQRGRVMKRDVGGAQGEIPSNAIEGRFVAPYLRGKTLHSAVGSPGVSAAGTGSAVGLWPLGAGEELVCWLSVSLPETIELADPATDWELAADLESAVDETFAAPQNLGSLVVNQLGVTELVIDGDVTSNTDTWYRINITGVTGTTPANPVFHPIVVIGKRVKA